MCDSCDDMHMCDGCGMCRFCSHHSEVEHQAFGEGIS